MNYALLLFFCGSILALITYLAINIWLIARDFDEKLDEEKKEYIKNRAEFLRQYTIQKESENTQHIIDDDKFLEEMKWVSDQVKELEKFGKE